MSAGAFAVRLGYRPPLRFDLLLAFFRGRALQGVEVIDERSYARTVRVHAEGGEEAVGWVRVEDDAPGSALVATMSASLRPVAPLVCGRLCRQFDLDCDPVAVCEGLASLDALVPSACLPGIRVPGCFDGFETSVRAVLGQQVSIVAANRLAARVVGAFGEPVEAPIDGLTHAFPTAARIAAIDDIEGAFGALGIIRSRARAIADIARLVCEGELTLDERMPATDQMETLLGIKGIGPWSANYIAMRTMGYADAFLETDAGIKHALPDLSPKERLALAEQWRPWRSYATVSLWNSIPG